MTFIKRTAVTIGMISDAYARHGSVWAAGEELGIPGQMVSSLMKKAGIPTNKRWVTDADIEEIKKFYTETAAQDFDLGILAKRMERTRSTICRVAKRLGLSNPSRPSSKAHNSKMRVPKWRDKPHPRGMLGKKHTTKTLEQVSASSRLNWATWKTFGIGNMSPENLEKASKRQSAFMANRPPEKSFTRARGGRRPDLGETYFRSSWEANYARYLNLLMKLGAVQKWDFEPKTFWFDGVRRGTNSYKPDFRVFYKGDPIPEYIELKGWIVAKDRTKWRRMAKYHPEIKLVVIAPKEYLALKRKWQSAIPEWESSKGGGYKTGPRKPQQREPA